MDEFTADAIPPDWRALLGDYFDTAQWHSLQSQLQAELQLHSHLIRPDPQNFFRALILTPVAEVKVVILGQDPYHSPGIAQGLAFSIPQQIPKNSREFPSSLRNISKALALEGFGVLPHGDLQTWAKQGVLLLNATLTVRAHSPASHQKKGWEEFTDVAIRELSNQHEHIVFMLWGNYAKNKGAHIDRNRHLVLEAPHPSPFSASNGFFGCKHFSRANTYLTAHGETPIAWL